jgi:membrane fusion protein, multidrug efflux system
MEIRVTFACAVLAAASVLTIGCVGKSSPPPSAKKGGDGVPVTVATVARRDVPVDVQVIGNVESYSVISVKSQVGGELTKVYFQEGDYVKKGDRLFTIDPRSFDAQVHQAEAALARSVAQLSQAQANLARDQAQAKYQLAQANRYANLQKEGVVSTDQTEQLRSTADASAQAVTADLAAIESAKADINAQKATVENIRIQFGYTEIKSPVDGRTGNIAVKQGNVLSPNTMELTTINQVQPIYVTFSVPESQLPDVKKYMAAGKLHVVAAPQDETATAQIGTLTFVDNSVDMTTGTIKLKATFPNSDRKLWPGEFVRVTLRLTTQMNALTVPNQAVQTGQDGPFVYVVKGDRTVETRPVVLGARVDQDLVLNSGVEAGETVVTEGQLRLAPGSRVQIRNGNGPAGGRRPKAAS